MPRSKSPLPAYDAGPSPTEPPTVSTGSVSNTVLALTPDQLRELLSVVGGAANRSPELDVAVKALETLARTQGQFAEQQARTVGKSNAVGDDTGLSAFTFDPECAICRAGGDHPLDAHGQPNEKRKKAHPKPMLLHRAFFCGSPLTIDILSPLEASLINSFTGPKDARGGYGPDGIDGGWSARFIGHGTSRRLEIWLPFKGQDLRSNLPSLAQILAELLYGQDVTDQGGQLAMIQKLQQQVAELTARAAPQETP
jgi:hypothetical protein